MVEPDIKVLKGKSVIISVSSLKLPKELQRRRQLIIGNILRHDTILKRDAKRDVEGKNIEPYCPLRLEVITHVMENMRRGTYQESKMEKRRVESCC